MAALRHLSKRARAEASGGGGAGAWAEILALAAKPGVINLGQGFPDFPGHAAAQGAAQAALAGGQHNQYAPIPGSKKLRESLSALHKRMYGRAPDPEGEVCVTSSGTEAIYCAILGLVDPGDEVVFFEPFFPWYLPCIRMAGGVPRAVALPPPSFRLGGAAEELRAAFSPRTKLCVFNSPHNPTGVVATGEDLELVASLCREHDTLCLSDEVYEACVFPGATHARVCDLPGMWERTLTIGSASKLLSLTGWRVGWASGPADLVKAVSTMRAYTTFSAPAPLQQGVADALDTEPSGKPSFEGRAELMHENWERLAAALRCTGVEVCPASGGYFLVADCSATGMRDMEYCTWLAEEHRVAAVPLSVFYHSAKRPESLVRFAVCKEPGTISAAAANLVGATVESARAYRAARAG